MAKSHNSYSRELERLLALLPDAHLQLDNETLWPPGADITRQLFRYVPEGGQVRDFDEIPNAELDAACRWVISRSIGVSVEDAIREVSRVFGASRTGTSIQATLQNAIDRLVDSGVLRREGETLSLREK